MIDHDDIVALIAAQIWNVGNHTGGEAVEAAYDFYEGIRLRRDWIEAERKAEYKSSWNPLGETWDIPF